MAAGLADHVWSLEEWLTFPAVQQLQDTTTLLNGPAAYEDKPVA